MEVTTVDFALKYAEKGWRVFPLQPKSKIPMKDFHWDAEATTEANKIVGWYEFNPNANLAIATGPDSHIFVLDIDGPEGAAWLERMTEKFGELPKTPMAHTKRGRHFIFKYPEGREIRNSAKKLADGVDVRGAGGYIVAPPSIHPETGLPYTWDKDHLPSQVDVADAPEWLLTLIELAASRQQETKSAAPALSANGVVEGGRNQYLISQAGSMRKRGMEYEAILAALKVENEQKCVPPLPDREVETIARSATRYEPDAVPQVMTDRDRAQAEWAFAYSVYTVTDYIKEFMWLSPSKFSNPKLAKFWSDLTNGVEPVAAATDANILADLERMTSADVMKVDGYASAIQTYGYFDVVRRYAGLLTQAANSGDTGKVDQVVTEIVKNVQPTGHSKVVSISEATATLRQQIEERAKNPVEVWGIPYSPHTAKDLTWASLSKFTGGKQKGELTLIAGEPGIGKSWWTLQDALFTAIFANVPVFIWSGEMKRDQVLRRAYQILGVNGRNMKTGNMTPMDWDMLNEAEALVLNSPIYISDTPGLALHDLKALLYRQKVENGIEQFVIDYAYLVGAPGKDEIERTANVSRETKIMCQELDLVGHLIASVNKTGMDGKEAAKGAMRGSGQQIHDADNIFFLTNFQQIPNDQVALRYLPVDYDRLITAHFVKGRELEGINGGRLHFARLTGSPALKEEPQNLISQ